MRRRPIVVMIQPTMMTTHNKNDRLYQVVLMIINKRRKVGPIHPSINQSIHQSFASAMVVIFCATYFEFTRILNATLAGVHFAQILETRIAKPVFVP
jgi:hypothetical protein